MSNEKKSEPVREELPGWVKKTPELLPVWDWWVREGRSTITLLLVAAICISGWFAFRNWRANRATAANNALMNAFSTDELEEAVAKFGGSPTGPALRLRLGKSYLAAERWDEAEKVYSDYVAEAKKDDPFASLAMLGRAYALEGGQKIDDAKGAYELLCTDTNLPVFAGGIGHRPLHGAEGRQGRSDKEARGIERPPREEPHRDDPPLRPQPQGCVPFRRGQLCCRQDRAGKVRGREACGGGSKGGDSRRREEAVRRQSRKEVTTGGVRHGG